MQHGTTGRGDIDPGTTVGYGECPRGIRPNQVVLDEAGTQIPQAETRLFVTRDQIASAEIRAPDHGRPREIEDHDSRSPPRQPQALGTVDGSRGSSGVGSDPISVDLIVVTLSDQECVATGTLPRSHDIPTAGTLTCKTGSADQIVVTAIDQDSPP